jgi:hypothetical protein
VQIAVRTGIVIFGLLVALAAWDASRHRVPPPEVLQAQLAVSRHLAQEAVESFGPGEDWATLSVETADLTHYVLAIRYAAAPQKPGQVEADARAVASAMLYQLTLASHHPADEGVSIVARAEAGEPGSPTVLGAAHYDPAADKIVFDPAGR